MKIIDSKFMKRVIDYFSITLTILSIVIFSSCSGSDPGIVVPVDPVVIDPEPEIYPDPWTGMQVVLFTPSDVVEPSDVDDRMKEVVDYTEWFFNKWMTYWGYPVDTSVMFHKDKDGYPIVWSVKGEKTLGSGAYDELGYAGTEVIPNAIDQYSIPRSNQLWWIISYPGPESSAYRGGGTSQAGSAKANFYSNLGQLILPGDDNLSEGAAADFKLKAMIHEMTHGFGVAHIGPTISEGFGNSLMGPTNSVYSRYYPEDKRVYLSKAVSAMLWKHPIFQGEYSSVDPKVSVSNLTYSYSSEEDIITVSGELVSDVTAHSVVISNDSDDDRSEYWRQLYTNRLNEDNSFTCSIPSPAKCSGILEMVFCFDNGHVSGTTGTEGFNKSLKCDYIYEDGEFSFTLE